MKPRALHRLFGLVLLLSAPLCVAQSTRNCTALRYTLKELPLRPSGINDAGDVVGTTESHRAALWTEAAGLQELGVPAGFTSSEGIGLNRHRDVIGIAVNLTTNRRQGFTYKDGKLELLSGRNARPFAINDSGQIAGELVRPEGTDAPVIWQGAKTVDLGGCCGGVASGINRHSEVIGNLYDQDGRYQAFLWDKGRGMQHIGPPGAFSSALAINDGGHVLIESFSRGVSLYRDGKLTPLALSPKLPGHPKSINDCDVVVGAFGPFADENQAFVWDAAQGFRNLNDLVTLKARWVLREATAINNQGQIVGWGERSRDEDFGFLLVPER